MTGNDIKDQQKPRLIIGLTGGIGSGKTAASNIFEKLGIDVIDADVLARQALASGSPLLDQVFLHFGYQLQNKDGGLDRAQLRELVFNNQQARIWLEQLIHPWVAEQVSKALKLSQSTYSILSSPLLLETAQHQGVDRVLVIDVPEALQIERTCQRDGNTPELVERILAQQIRREDRLERADDVINNTGNLSELQQQVECLHQHYLKLAEEKNA